MTDAAPAPALPARRPGGLTALAVLNIVFAFIGALGGLAMNAINRDEDAMSMQAHQFDIAAERIANDPNQEGNPELNRAMLRGMAAGMHTTAPGAYRVMFGSGLLAGVLLLLSGFGLLGQKRVLGRYGSMAACAALFVCGGVAVSKLSFMFWGFPMMGAGYAMVLLCLVHFAYRPALQR